MANKNKNQITKKQDNKVFEKPENNNQSHDYLADTKRALDYLEEHPRLGVAAGGTLTAGGIITMIYYGSKAKRA